VPPGLLPLWSASSLIFSLWCSSLAVLDSAQNSQSLHLLKAQATSTGWEARFQGSIPLYIFTIVVQSSGAYALQFPLASDGLSMLAASTCALSGSGTDHGVEFIDKEDAVSRSFYFFNNLL